jgi:hypothetical protein
MYIESGNTMDKAVMHLGRCPDKLSNNFQREIPAVGQGMLVQRSPSDGLEE